MITITPGVLHIKMTGVVEFSSVEAETLVKIQNFSLLL